MSLSEWWHWIKNALKIEQIDESVDVDRVLVKTERGATGYFYEDRDEEINSLVNCVDSKVISEGYCFYFSNKRTARFAQKERKEITIEDALRNTIQSTYDVSCGFEYFIVPSRHPLLYLGYANRNRWKKFEWIWKENTDALAEPLFRIRWVALDILVEALVRIVNSCSEEEITVHDEVRLGSEKAHDVASETTNDHNKEETEEKDRKLVLEIENALKE